jgi:nucleoside-diphosphate-sugar epimerase
MKSVFGDMSFDFIIHCAAIAPLPECQIDGYRAITENIACTGSVVDFCLSNGIDKIIFFSSGAIYEGCSNFPTPEISQVNTKLIYPTTKYLAEQYLQAMTRSHELKVISLRLFNLYGPHQDYFRKQPPLMGYLLKCIIENNPVILFSSGEQQRDYIYIDDLVNLIRISMKYMCGLPDKNYYESFNVGSGITYSVNGIIEMIENVTNRRFNISRTPSESYWSRYDVISSRAIPLSKSIIQDEVEKFTQADISKANKILNWHPKITMENGINECYKFALKLLGHK